jgi:hypothetical protein
MRVLVAVIAGCVAVALAPPAHGADRYCGKLKAKDGAVIRIKARYVSCRTAMAVHREFWHGDEDDQLFWGFPSLGVTLKKFPGWRCTWNYEGTKHFGACSRRRGKGTAPFTRTKRS